MTQNREATAEKQQGGPKHMQTDRLALAMLSLGHLADDIGQGALPVMLPFFIAAHNLSYSAAAGLVLAITVSSSIIQPLLGQYSDRRPSPWLVPAGLFVAGAGMAVASIMPNYLLIALAIGASGIGVAAFHPEAARLANFASGARRATGMSMFTLGGNAGFAVGPLMAAPLMLAFGLPGGLLIAVPSTIMAIAIALHLNRFASRRQSAAGKASARATGQDAWGPFLRLSGAVMSRSVVLAGLNTFIPLYWRDILNQPIAAGSAALTILYTSGAAGTLLGGWLADRYGRRRVVLVTMGALTALLAVFVSLQDAALATLLMVPLGVALSASTSVMVVMGQEYLPNRIGTASGVTLGLAVSFGGLVAPLLGMIGDNYGLQAVMTLLIAVPAAAFAFVSTLPREHRATA